MRIGRMLTAVLIALAAAHAAGAGELDVRGATHDEVGRALDDLVGQIIGLGDRWRGHFSEAGERPVISVMLSHRDELGLSPAQVQALERLRMEYQREAIKKDADLRVAEMDLATLLKADAVDLAKVESKVREVERARGDLRLARIRAIEQARAQLSPDQRAKLSAMLNDRAPQPARSQRF